MLKVLLQDFIIGSDSGRHMLIFLSLSLHLLNFLAFIRLDYFVRMLTSCSSYQIAERSVDIGLRDDIKCWAVYRCARVESL